MVPFLENDLESRIYREATIKLLIPFLGFSALPTRKSTLAGNEHSRSCGCSFTQKKAAPLEVMCQRVKRQKPKAAKSTTPSNKELGKIVVCENKSVKGENLRSSLKIDAHLQVKHRFSTSLESKAILK